MAFKCIFNAMKLSINETVVMLIHRYTNNRNACNNKISFKMFNKFLKNGWRTKYIFILLIVYYLIR